MPNGGTDNCGECYFFLGGVCLRRHTRVINQYYSYCDNFAVDAIQGPIYANGLYDNGYVRIPWNDSYEPRKVISGICHICHQTFKDGLEVNTNDKEVLQFCSNEHYLDWWKEIHKND